MAIAIDLQGMILGSWNVGDLVLKRRRDGKSKRYYDCVCKQCGKRQEVSGEDLRKERQCRQCYLAKDHTGCANVKWTGYEEIPGTFWAAVLSGAKQRSLSVEISIREAWDLFLKQNRKCALTGINLSFRQNYRSQRGTASLDRISSDYGYTLFNTQWLHKDVNMMKTIFHNNALLKFANYYVIM